MKVTLTDRQYAALCDALVHNNRLDIADFIDEHNTRRTKIKFIDFYGPATMWRQIRDICIDELFVVRRYPLSTGRAQVLQRALKAVAQAVALREHHPAIRNKAVYGRQNDILPAWHLNGEWSPYPNDGKMWIMTPIHAIDARLEAVTSRWVPQQPELWSRPDFPWLHEHINIEFL